MIVGGTGNLGTALVRQLTDGGGHRVTVVARRLSGDSDARGLDDVDEQQADLSLDDLRPVVRGADVVVNLGWLFQPSHRPEVTWSNNAVGAARLFEAVEREGVPALVVSSSVAAYSPAVGHALVDETWPTHGASAAAYSREKAYVERLLDVFEAANPGTRVVRVRPAFVFQQSSAAQQRRLFAGPLVPGSLLRPGLVPVLPFPTGLQFQAIHSDDVARALAAAATGEATGAFNLAAADVVHGDDLAGLLGARQVPVPPRAVRTALAAAWRAHAVPAPPDLFDALLRLPMMSIDRARAELDWEPQVTAQQALQELLAGLRSGTGGSTPPLAADAGGRGRWREFVTGVGEKDDPA